eukprot:CAMPEP_0197425194 /NCGR_PEP_ID=MMETSP1170-20131217/29564_1 /TAXON_ID=54406 /ORGANISM="Sarcinochrysis sp, Strain CCMP770" /LENGTH=157 /DNA_ID=CAMNT_0042952731 /DNA_START=11 /DNA_END=484 /DNA_ORIENTATION=+
MSVKATVRLICPAGAAKPGPAIGQALGPHGLNMMEFCKAFNAETQRFKPETPIPVVLKAYSNRTFSFVTKSPPTSYLIREMLGLQKGASAPGSEIVGQMTWSQIKEIAAVKHQDQHLSHIPFEGICRSIAGSAASMGVAVVEDQAEEAAPTTTEAAD